MERTELILDIPAELERNIFGELDIYVKKIEKTLDVSVVTRDGASKLIGPENAVRSGKWVFDELLILANRGNQITEQNV
ncbi:MAG: phosphate starvation-inducible protein PhoH, partial [Eubacterium sp.]|nr:phosphate starvation-inducible protein PhoH [Eubacterium sp.]